MRRLIPWLLVITALLAPAAAHAFARTTSGDVDGGACLYWGPRSVHYVINSAGLDGWTPQTLKASVEAGFDAWEGWDCSDFVYVDDGTTDSQQVGYNRVLVSQPNLTADIPNEHLVVFRQQACSDVVPTGDDCLDPANDDCDNKYDCWQDDVDTSGDVLAFTLVTSETTTGRILDADTAFDAVDFQFRDLVNSRCDDDIDPSACEDLQNTMAHESGHFLGLAHSQDVNATMYYAVTMDEETLKRDLDDDDVAGLCAIYPYGAPPVTCVPAQEDDVYGEGCGCDSGSSYVFWTLLPLLRVAKRRRVH